MRTKISQWGNSAGVRLPKEALADAGLKIGQEVELIPGRQGIEVRAPSRRLTVDELFAMTNKQGLREPPPLDWGEDVGAEILPEDEWSDIAPSDAEMGIRRANRRRPRTTSR